MLELAENTSTIIAAILGVFAVLSAVIVWFDRRQKTFANAAVDRANASSSDLRTKVNEMDHDLGAVAKDVTGIKRDLGMLSGRVHHVERALETVAKQSDVAVMNADVRSLMAQFGVMQRMMHSFHESALRAAERKDN